MPCFEHFFFVVRKVLVQFSAGEFVHFSETHYEGDVFISAIFHKISINFLRRKA